MSIHNNNETSLSIQTSSSCYKSINNNSNLSSLKHLPTILCDINVTFSYSTFIYRTQISSTIIDSYHISLNDILQELESKINLENFQISYKSEHKDEYIYCGLFPLSTQILFPCSVNSKSNIKVNIKLRQMFNSLRSTDVEDEDKETREDTIVQRITVENYCNKSKRAKERKIGYIINKVYIWRKMYCGFVDDNGQYVKLNLEEAADKVGISKKSLDDYLIQLRMGKMLGFNFNEHKNDKVGVLRTFIKKNKATLKSIKEGM